jgi:hypothetical protein
LSPLPATRFSLAVVRFLMALWSSEQEWKHHSAVEGLEGMAFGAAGSKCGAEGRTGGGEASAYVVGRMDSWRTSEGSVDEDKSAAGAKNWMEDVREHQKEIP